MTDHKQVECYKCQVWIDDFQSKVIDGDDYCCECAYIAIFNEHDKLKMVLEIGKLWVESRNIPIHESVGTHTLQRADRLTELRLDFESALADALADTIEGSEATYV